MPQAKIKIDLPQLTGRHVQALITFLLVSAVVVVVNYLGRHYHKRWDVTGSQLYSLSPKTLKVLKGLDGNVEALYFYKDDPNDPTGDLLKEFGVTSSRFEVVLVDLDKRPELAQQYQVNDYEVLVLRYQNRFRKLNAPEEQQITNAVVQLTQGKQKYVYFTVGHGERSFQDFDREGMSKMEDLIKGQNIRIDTIVLARTRKVPDDCDLLVVNGGNRKWLLHEVDQVSAYTDSGGNLFLNLDDNKTGLNALTQKRNVQLGKAVVVDLTASLFGGGPGITTLLEYEYHAITKDFRLMTAYEMPCELIIKQDSLSEWEITPFLRSSDQSWGEMGTVDESVDYNEGVDRKGPIPFGVAVKPRGVSKRYRVVLVGDSKYASNSYMGFAGNSDLYLNALSWLTEQEDLIAIRSRELSYQRVDATEGQAVAFFGLSLVALPLGIVAVGVVVWLRRRN